MNATEEFLKSGFITVDIFAVSPVDEHAGQTAMLRRADDRRRPCPPSRSAKRPSRAATA